MIRLRGVNKKMILEIELGEFIASLVILFIVGFTLGYTWRDEDLKWKKHFLGKFVDIEGNIVCVECYGGD